MFTVERRFQGEYGGVVPASPQETRERNWDSDVRVGCFKHHGHAYVLL